MKVLAIRKPDASKSAKVVEANQKAVDALPLNSGTWRVEGYICAVGCARNHSLSSGVSREISLRKPWASFP
jgi:hypothetical protein